MHVSIISAANLELCEGVTRMLMTTTEIPTDIYYIYIIIYICIIYIMTVEKMWRQKFSPTVFFCIPNRKKLMWDVSDLLGALGIIYTKNFFHLLVFLRQRNGHLTSFFFSYVIPMPFRNLEGKKWPVSKFQARTLLLQNVISILTRDIMVISVCSSIVELTRDWYPSLVFFFLNSSMSF